MQTKDTAGQAAELADQIRRAEDDAQDARYSGDVQAQGYAEGRALAAKRKLAALDPRGYGHQYLNLLSEAERENALRGDRALAAGTPRASEKQDVRGG